MIYNGSQFFLSLSEKLDISIHMLNFLLAQVFAIVFGLLFRAILPPNTSQTRATQRHLVATTLGLGIGYFLYGHEIVHLLLQHLGSYLAIRFIPRKHVHLVLFAFSMAYLNSIQLYGQIMDYGNYTLDISCAMMISTQKLTALGFAYYDGIRSQDALTDDQKTQVVYKRPTFLELASYICNFQGIVVGPLCYYREYIDFVTGHNILKHSKQTKQLSGSDQDIHQPSVLRPVLVKTGIAFFFLTIYLVIIPTFPVLRNISQETLASPLLHRLYVLYASGFCQRSRFYFLWVFADATNNASGLGFNGYDKGGRAKWDLVSNIYPVKLELATSMKSFFDYWNMQTQLWLRRIAYDRLSTGKTLGVFVLSAFWHGFYPSYYLTFISAAFFVYAGRGIRRKVRPYFQQNALARTFYSVITLLVTSFVVNMTGCSHYLMSFDNSFAFNKSFYWFIHIASAIIAIVLPAGSTKKPKEKPKDN